jgi:hypothetical protein
MAPKLNWPPFCRLRARDFAAGELDHEIAGEASGLSTTIVRDHWREQAQRLPTGPAARRSSPALVAPPAHDRLKSQFQPRPAGADEPCSASKARRCSPKPATSALKGACRSGRAASTRAEKAAIG